MPLSFFDAEDSVCGTCAHFVQHYLKSGVSFQPAPSGHCTYSRIKYRAVDQTCSNWQANPPKAEPEGG